MKQFNLEEYLKNPSRKLVTGDGRKVTRVLCTDARGPFPVVVLVERFDRRSDVAHSYTSDGHYYEKGEHPADLFFTPEKREGWINLYKDAEGNYVTSQVYERKESAEASSCRTCIATVKIEWDE